MTTTAKAKRGGRQEAGGLPADVRQLLRLLIGEMQTPRDMQKLLDDLPPVADCAREAALLLKAKDRAARREDYIRNEALWFRKYGWFMARVIGLFGLIVFVPAVFARGAGVDFFTYMLLGVAGYYLLLVTLSNLRYRDRNRKRRRLLEREAQNYQKAIVAVAASLMKRWNLDAARYPVERPYNRAGLELRDDGNYYVPLD